MKLEQVIGNGSGLASALNTIRDFETFKKMQEEVMRSLCIPASLLQGDFNYSSARLDANLFPPKKPVESRALIVRP
jgi:hypothetical protein